MKTGLRSLNPKDDEQKGGCAMLKNFTNEKYDIIILAGQSNAEGSGFGPVEDPFVPDERV